MKKILFFAVALVALVGMASCANNEKANEQTTVADSVVTDTVVDGDSSETVVEVDTVAPEAEK